MDLASHARQAPVQDSIDGDTAAERLAEWTRDMAVQDSIEAVLQAAVEVAVREVPGAQFASVIMLGRDCAQTRAVTDEVVAEVDMVQYRIRQGPSIEAVTCGHTVRCNDLSAVTRWPELSSVAADRGIRSVLSLPLFTAVSTFGSLNLYAHASAAFGAASEHTAFLLAAHATAAIVTTRKTAELQAALHSRVIIEQAKGVLAQQLGVSMDTAFRHLRGFARSNNLRLPEVARRVVQDELNPALLSSRPSSPPTSGTLFSEGMR